MANSLYDSLDQEDCELQEWTLIKEKDTKVTYPYGFTEDVLQNSGFSYCPVARLNTDKKWWI